MLCTEKRDAMAERLHSGTLRAVWLLEDFCEKVSVSYVSCDPGDRHWNDLLGQRAQRPVELVVDGSADAVNEPDALDAATTRAGNAARLAADSVVFAVTVTESVDAASQHARPVTISLRSAASVFAVAFIAEPVFEP